MNISEFYIKVLDAFEKNKVEYMVVGGHAVNFHGYTRATSDMDLWINTNEINFTNLYQAFVELGYNENSVVNAIYQLRKNHIIKIPKDNIVIDILDSFIVQNDFDNCYKNLEKTKIEGVHIKIMGLEDLINCKNKSNRMKDLLDVKNLEELREIRKSKK